MPNKTVHPFLLIGVVALIGMMAPFSIDTYLPSFPSIEANLLVSRELLTQSLSIYLLCFAVATLFWGPLSDRFGRRPIVLASLIGYFLASLLCALASNYETLLLGRALQGATVAGSMVASRAMIRDYFSSQMAQKALSINMMLFSVAPALAPVLGGWLEVTFGWRSVFYFLVLYALLLGWLFTLKVPETKDKNSIQSIQPKALMLSYYQTTQHPLFLKIVLVQGALIGGFFIYIAGSTSVVFDHLNLKEQEFWLFFAPLVLGIFLGSMASHRLTYKMQAPQTVNLALWIALISVASNIFLETTFSTAVLPMWLIIAPLTTYAFAFALANPALTVMGLDCLPEKKGMASSVQSLFQMGTAGLSAALIVPISHDSLAHMAQAQGLVLLFAITLWLTHQATVKQNTVNS